MQPEWAVPSEGDPPLIYTKGSFYATIETGSKSIGEDVEYTVVCNDGSHLTLPRCRLRHRVWHRVAFLGVTNEKQHVALTTQAVPYLQLVYLATWLLLAPLLLSYLLSSCGAPLASRGALLSPAHHVALRCDTGLPYRGARVLALLA